jgi:hypothetical protein
MCVYTSKQSSTIGAKVLQIHGFPGFMNHKCSASCSAGLQMNPDEPGGCLAAKHTWISTKLSGHARISMDKQ